MQRVVPPSRRSQDRTAVAVHSGPGVRAQGAGRAGPHEARREARPDVVGPQAARASDAAARPRVRVHAGAHPQWPPVVRPFADAGVGPDGVGPRGAAPRAGAVGRPEAPPAPGLAGHPAASWRQRRSPRLGVTRQPSACSRAVLRRAIQAGASAATRAGRRGVLRGGARTRQARRSETSTTGRTGMPAGRRAPGADGSRGHGLHAGGCPGPGGDPPLAPRPLRHGVAPGPGPPPPPAARGRRSASSRRAGKSGGESPRRTQRGCARGLPPTPPSLRHPGDREGGAGAARAVPAAALHLHDGARTHAATDGTTPATAFPAAPGCPLVKAPAWQRVCHTESAAGR